MNFLSVKETGYTIYPVYNTYTRLRKVIECVKDEEEITSFNENKNTIYERLELLINDDNKHLLPAIFLIYIVCMSIAYRSHGEKIWVKCLDLIEKVCSNNSNEAIYYYTGLACFYIEENYAHVTPNDNLFYNEDNLNFQDIFKEVLKLDDELRIIFEKYNKITREVIRGNQENSLIVRKNLNAVLRVIVSYCIVNKEYDKFDELVQVMLNNKEDINEKVELNGLRGQLSMDKIADGNPYAEQCVEYVLDMIFNENKRTIS